MEDQKTKQEKVSISLIELISIVDADALEITGEVTES